MNGLKVLLASFSFFIFCGCDVPVIDDDNGDSFSQDAHDTIAYIVHENDTSIFLLLSCEIGNITLSETPYPESILVAKFKNFRLPSKQEAQILKGLEIDSLYSIKQRILCKDYGTNEYYTYSFGGKVVKAGKKTKYKIIPFATEPTPRTNISYNIFINDYNIDVVNIYF